MFWKRPAAALAAAFLMMSAAAAAAPPALETMLKRPLFYQMGISPDGKHLAATVPMGDDRTILAVLDRETLKVTATLQLREDEHASSFVWANDQRILVMPSKKLGLLDRPAPTGEIYAINADGSQSKMLFGYRAQRDGLSKGNLVKQEWAGASVLHRLPDDKNEVLIGVYPWRDAETALPEVRTMDVRTGRTNTVTRAPMPQSSFMTDNDGRVRLNIAERPDMTQVIHVRAAKGGSWSVLHDERDSGYALVPLAFEADGKHVLARREHTNGADSLVRWNIDDNTQKEVAPAGVADPEDVLMDATRRNPYAWISYPGRPEVSFLDPQSREARLLKALNEAFPGQYVMPTSFTRDGKLGLVAVMSDRNSPEFYLIDTETMKARYLASSRQWLDPKQMSESRPVAIKARDGTTLHGYLFLPEGKAPKQLPLIVNPHGGPHGIRDYWGFDEEAQIFASRGYAVLKVNFRGSGGYGTHFQEAGYREWAGLMQDDLADAVRWTISEGYADKDRVCIYGASYGGYAALMNSARYPELYRCTVGYVGVYDLPLMYKDGDIPETIFGRKFLERVIGKEGLEQASPLHHAEKITMPVMLVHGGEDFRVPQKHADRMREALRKAGNEPEWLVKRSEGHGFYVTENKIELYTKLLAFFDRHIGENAKPAQAAKPAQ